MGKEGGLGGGWKNSGGAGSSGYSGISGRSGYSGIGSSGYSGYSGTNGVAVSAYGYAAGQNDATIGADSNVTFDLGATPFPNAGFTSVPAAGGTDAGNGNAFVVATTGDYEFDFYIASTTHPAFATTPLVFALWRNGAIASVGGNAFEFRGTFLNASQTCIGHGIIHLTAGDVIQLHNRTNTVTDAVTVASTQTGVEASPNRTLSLHKIA